MKRTTSMKWLSGLAIAWLLSASTAWAGIIADVRSNYVAGTLNGQTTQNVTGNPAGLSDTAGTGIWNFYRLDYNVSDNPENPSYDGVLTLLPYNTTDFNGTYRSGISVVTPNEIWDNMVPGADEVAWHGGGVPGDSYNGAKQNTVIRWTAGATAPSMVDLSGDIRLPFSGYSAKTVSIFVNNVLQWSYTAINGVDVDNNVSHTYDLANISITPGTTIDYVLKSGSGGRAALGAQITAIPEPGSLSLLGLLGGALLLRRKLRK